MWNNGPTTATVTTGTWSVTIWSRNGHATTSACVNYPPRQRHITKAERRFEEELEKFKGDQSKLLAQLRVREATKKAASDKASRAQRAHPGTRKDLGRRLQTYDAAMAARMAARRP